MKILYVFLLALTPSLVACSQEALPDTVSDDLVDAIDSTELLPSLHPLARFLSMQTGEIQVHPSLNFENWNSQKVGNVDFGSIVGAGEKVEMIAVGGGLTAGVCNGGLYREGQLFAYPNLVAHQMGLTDFEMPLFSENDFNGTGYYLYDNPLAKYPKWKKVTNNRAPVTGGVPPVLPKYEGNTSNFATPVGSSQWLKNSDREDLMFRPYLARFATPHDDDNSPESVITDIKRDHSYNFVLIDDFFDHWIETMQLVPNFTFGNFNGSIEQYGDIVKYSINEILNQGQKGIIFTVPHFRTLPYMNWFKFSELLDPSTNPDASYLMPAPFISRIFEQHKPGSKFTTRLDAIYVVDAQEASFADPASFYNPKIKDYAQRHNLAVVDLYEVYERIHAGSYVTDDGYAIDGTMKGNFFSSDGIYPTALGQAVVANEVIYAINSKYHSQIPLINISEFVKTIGFKK